MNLTMSSKVNQAWQMDSTTKNGLCQSGRPSGKQSDLVNRGRVSRQSKTIATSVIVTETTAMMKALRDVSGCSNNFQTACRHTQRHRLLKVKCRVLLVKGNPSQCYGASPAV